MSSPYRKAAPKPPPATRVTTSATGPRSCPTCGLPFTRSQRYYGSIPYTDETCTSDTCPTNIKRESRIDWIQTMIVASMLIMITLVGIAVYAYNDDQRDECVANGGTVEYVRGSQYGGWICVGARP